MPSLNSVTFWVMTRAAGAGASEVMFSAVSGSSTVNSCGSSVSAENTGSGEASVHSAVGSGAGPDVPGSCGREGSDRRGAGLSETRTPAAMNAVCRAASHTIPGTAAGDVPAAAAEARHSAAAAVLSSFFFSMMFFPPGYRMLFFL